MPGAWETLSNNNMIQSLISGQSLEGKKKKPPKKQVTVQELYLDLEDLQQSKYKVCVCVGRGGD